MMEIARDRSTTPSIDLDQTASSCVILLPKTNDEIPVFWWCAATPSNGCYVPFFVHGDKIPEIVSKAGNFGKKVLPPSKVKRDAFSQDSYWWLSRDLCDKINFDREKRHREARDEFNRLEKDFEAGISPVIQKAMLLRNQGKNTEAASLLGNYSEKCVQKVIQKVNELRERFKNPPSEVPGKFKPYIGIYTGNFGHFRGADFKILFKNNKLAIEIPGQTTVELLDPDEEGLHYFSVTDKVAVSFEEDQNHNITAMRLHQTTQLPRSPKPANIPEDTPADYLPYIGKYTITMKKEGCTVLTKDGQLAIFIPGQAVMKLQSPDSKGKWRFASNKQAAVSFIKDSDGNVRAMNIHQVFELPRKKLKEKD
jgi:hypothetical protein